MLPLLRGFGPEQPILFDQGRPIGAAAFCGIAAAVSTRLPAARFAFNLCEGRAEFLLASAAAMLAGHTLILPPSRLARTLDDLRAAYPRSYCLVDSGAAAHERRLLPTTALDPGRSFATAAQSTEIGR